MVKFLETKENGGSRAGWVGWREVGGVESYFLGKVSVWGDEKGPRDGW